MKEIKLYLFDSPSCKSEKSNKLFFSRGTILISERTYNEFFSLFTILVFGAQGEEFCLAVQQIYSVWFSSIREGG